MAEHGVSRLGDRRFRDRPRRRSHPLIRGAARVGARRYFVASASTALPIRRSTARRFTPFRFAADDDRSAHGLLLASAHGAELHPDVTWLARLLARQIGRLLSRQHTRRDPLRAGADAALQHHQRRHRSDPADRHRGQADHRQLARRKAVRRAGGRERRLAPRRGAEQHAVLGGALDERRVQTDLARRELLLVDPLEGSDLLFELLSSRAKDERQGTFVVSILRNVTDLARAREEIEESYRTLRVAQAEVRDERHRLDLIIDSVADPILVTDQEGDIVLMNEPAERLFTVPSQRRRSARSAASAPTART